MNLLKTTLKTTLIAAALATSAFSGSCLDALKLANSEEVYFKKASSNPEGYKDLIKWAGDNEKKELGQAFINANFDVEYKNLQMYNPAGAQERMLEWINLLQKIKSLKEGTNTDMEKHKMVKKWVTLYRDNLNADVTTACKNGLIYDEKFKELINATDDNLYQWENHWNLKSEKKINDDIKAFEAGK